MNQPHRSDNPFPGLRPFTPEEDYLFFGREEQTMELLQSLGAHRFVAVVGTSGSGKSSLVRCGLLSQLLGGKMLAAGTSWEVAVTHPGAAPMNHLAESLLAADLYDAAEEDAKARLLATLSRSHLGLIEAVRQAQLPAGTNFLLVVDQFEEIFRFNQGGAAQRDAANEFVSMLLQAAAQKDVPIYIVLTMRSDFIGDCAQFEHLAEAVNRGEYLIPRMTRDQFKHSIEGPIRVAGGTITPRLLQRLLNDLGDQADQLPCLQHALMRTWDQWKRSSSEGQVPRVPNRPAPQSEGRVPRVPDSKADVDVRAEFGDSQSSSLRGESGDSRSSSFRGESGDSRSSSFRGIRSLDLEDYDAIGRMREALSRHADELYESLGSDRARQLCAAMFKALTLRESENRGIRRPQTLGRLAQIVDVPAAELAPIVEAFRQPGVTFLMPPPEVPLAGATVIDISHESLMRVWVRLRDWVEEEASSVGIFHRLAESAALHEKGKAGLYRDPELGIALSWRDEAHANAAWADQYGGHFDRAMAYLDQSREAAQREEKEREAARQRELERAQQFAEAQAKVARLFKRFAGSLAVGMCLAIALTIWAFTLRQEAKRQEAAAQQQRALAQEKQVEAEKARNDSQRLLYGANLNLIQGAVEQANYVSAARLLAETGEYPNRGFEWYHWQKQMHGETRTFRGHFTNITALTFSPDSRLVASGDAAGTIHIWDHTTGEVRHSDRRDRGISSLAYSPDGTQLLAGTSASPGGLRSRFGPRMLILNTVTGGEPVAYDGMRSGAYSPDGRQIVAVDDRAVYLLDPQHLKTTPSARLTPFIDLLAQESPSEGQAGDLSPWWVGFSKDGGTVVTGAGDWPAPPLRIRFWDARTGRRAGPLIDRKQIAMKSMAISPDGRLIAVAGAAWHTAEIWSAVTGEKMKTLVHEGNVQSMQFSPDGKYLVTGAVDLTARLWDIQTWLGVRRLGGGLKPITSVAFSPDSRWLATGDGEGTVRIWEVEAGQNPYVALRIEADHHRQTKVSPDGRLAVSPHNAGATLTDMLTGKVIRTLRPDPVPTDGYIYVTSAEFSPDGKSILTASFRGGAVDIFDATSGARERHFPHAGFSDKAKSVWFATFSPDGKRIATAAMDGKVRIWDLASSTPIRVLNAYSERAYYVSFSPDGRRLVTGGIEGTQVWDADSGLRLLALGNSEGGGEMAVFSPDGQRIATTSAKDTAVRVLDATNFGIQITLSGHKGVVHTVRFSADGKRILTAGGDRTARLWDAETGREVTTLKGHESAVISAEFLHDGRRIVTSSPDSTVRIWEAATDRDIATWKQEEKARADNIKSYQARIAAEQAAKQAAKQVAEQAAQSKRIKDPMAIKQWLISAPIPYHGDGVAALEQEQLPNEATLRPRASQPVTTTNVNFKWTAVNRDSYALNFSALLGLAPPDTDNKVAYAVTYIRTDTTRTNLHMKVGSDDQSKILLNGEEVYRSTEPRGWQPDQDTVPGIKLKPGLNTLVFKVVNGVRDWAGSVWITDADGNPIPGLTVTLDPDAKQ